MKTYHVAKKGLDANEGSLKNPFLTINKAASLAEAGDTVVVHEGVYREWVKPKNKGLSQNRRITYTSAEGEKVIIKGSDIVNEWTPVEGTVWKTILSNKLFGDFNPYSEVIFGDWLATTDSKHLGDLYLNGQSFYESSDYKALLDSKPRNEMTDGWTKNPVHVRNPEDTKYVWYAEVNEDTTILYGNFHNYNPNDELTEINVRRSCFYPTAIGIDYITVKGFEMAHAATQWAPPTAEQTGLLGAHWSKGWIIENNIIHDSKCSGISIGKEATTGDNYCSIRKDKPGYLYQLESVFSAGRLGWSRESVGSHILRNNTIYNCGQTGIVGHLGCIFSKIYNNHIYNIGVKREFYGFEIAGIKLHAPIDVELIHNRIHDCTLGMWMDWQTQGTRISRNLFYENTRDCYIEVSHGPYIVDHNIMISNYAMENVSQGGAYINNLITGKMVHRKVLPRPTQYHLPHSTEVAGFAPIYGGDDRFYNNIFVGGEGLENVGTANFDGYTRSMEEYIETVHEQTGELTIFTQVEQPVYINHNAYFMGAVPFNQESSPYVMNDYNPLFEVSVEDDGIYLSCNMPDQFSTWFGTIHNTDSLERARIVDAEFENPDGSFLTLDKDFLECQKDSKTSIGPIDSLAVGANHIRIWEINE